MNSRSVLAIAFRSVTQLPRVALHCKLRRFSSGSAGNLQELAPYRDAVRGQLLGVQSSLRDLASALTLGEDSTASGRHDHTNGFALDAGPDTEVLYLTTTAHCLSRSRLVTMPFVRSVRAVADCMSSTRNLNQRLAHLG